jgi:integrase
VSYADARYHFSKAVKKSGVRKLTIHSLRHAHASILIAKGVPITAISKRLGHTSPKVTLSIYSHSMAGSDEEIAKILDNF